jgi:hypothetical protein
MSSLPPSSDFPGSNWKMQMRRDQTNIGTHSRVSTAYSSGVSRSWQSASTTIAAASPFGFLGGKSATAYGHALMWGTTWRSFSPLWPWIDTELTGDYKGRKYDARFGFGYEEHVAAGHHPWTSWALRRDMERSATYKQRWFAPQRLSPAKHPLRGVPIPTFGFGWESVPRDRSRDSQVGRLPSNNGGSRSGWRRSRGPSAQMKQGGQSSSSPRGGTEGSRPSRRGSQSREKTTSRTRSPKCPVHNVHHWCNVTRKMAKSRSR